MIDKQAILEQVDLLALVEHDTTLKRVASTNGGEWAGPCPHCGGKDRFRIQPYHDRGVWMCRHCTEGRWDNAIGYIMRRDNCDFIAACKCLAGGELPKDRSGQRQRPPEVPAYSAPAEDWQVAARQVIETCKSQLWGEGGQKALEYLKGRGLRESTIERFNLGYSTGQNVVDLWVPRGVVIPGVVRGEVWYIKIRLPAKPGGQKYICVTGSRPAAIFNSDDLLTGPGIALFCEGEFDCLIAWQELQELVTVVTFGSATNRPDLATWGPYLLGLQRILACYDDDEEGQRGISSLAQISDFVELALLPAGAHDINDYKLTGASLVDWLLPYLAAHEALEGEAAKSNYHPQSDGTK